MFIIGNSEQKVKRKDPNFLVGNGESEAEVAPAAFMPPMVVNSAAPYHGCEGQCAFAA
jgi:hypothetical protein